MGIDTAKFALAEAIEREAKVSTNLKDLALASSGLEKLNGLGVENTVETSIYEIGLVGEMGFGVASCPDELLKTGYVKMTGHNDKSSKNYGRLMDSNGSEFFYIPPFHYKMVGNVITIASKQTTGFNPAPFMLWDSNGFYAPAYLMGNVGGKLVSKQYLDPVSTKSSHNPIGDLQSAPANNYGGFVDACNAMGYKCLSIFEWHSLALLSLAQSQSGAGSESVAFNDIAPYFPKGCNNNALGDTNDSTLSFLESGYSNCALTGSANNIAKTTHNGQTCGVADVNGDMYKIVTGLTYMAKTTNGDKTTSDDTINIPSHSLAVDDIIYFGGSPSVGSTYNTSSYTINSISGDDITLDRTLDNDLGDGSGVYSPKYFRILKTTVHPSNITSANIHDETLYDLLDLTGIVDNNSGRAYFGNGGETVLNFSTVTSSREYKASLLGIPTADGTSGSGTTEFGNDRIYRCLKHGLVPIVGLNWDNASNAGVFSVFLDYYSSYSRDAVGGFASVSLS